VRRDRNPLTQGRTAGSLGRGSRMFKATRQGVLVDLAAQYQRAGKAIDLAIARVLNHGQFILGPEVLQLEQALAEFCGVRHCITCANGTDALQLVLMARGIGPGHAVFVPGFTYAATAEAAAVRGATPIFVDVHRDTFNLDASSLEAAIGVARRSGLEPKCVIAVDLFGQPADYASIHAVADAHNLFVIADAAQSFGAAWREQKVGSLAIYTTTSFYPSKPLGCYGDGGAILTDDDEANELLKSLRFHGQGRHRHEHSTIGLNSRLDTLQAAILLAKMNFFLDEIATRQAIAQRYTDELMAVITPPALMPGATSVWAQYTILSRRRDQLVAACQQAGVATAIHYPIPLHRQSAYRHFPTAAPNLTNCDWLSKHALSLPMHPYLDRKTQDVVIRVIQRAVSPEVELAPAMAQSYFPESLR
jgi:UDP-2-acetamido-2-deoxy-ribo-hexuluronate aminotransferase